jgi:hypothetical protein
MSPLYRKKNNYKKKARSRMSSASKDGDNIDFKKGSLKIEHLSSALRLLALAAKRGTFSIEEFSDVSAIYDPLDAFLKIWREELLKETSQDAAQ